MRCIVLDVDEAILPKCIRTYLDLDYDVVDPVLERLEQAAVVWFTDIAKVSISDGRVSFGHF